MTQNRLLQFGHPTYSAPPILWGATAAVATALLRVRTSIHSGHSDVIAARQILLNQDIDAKADNYGDYQYERARQQGLRYSALWVRQGLLAA